MSDLDEMIAKLRAKATPPTTGGFVIPESVAKAIIEEVRHKHPLRLLYPEEPRRPLTRRQRFRIWRIEAGWQIHDFLFPTCPGAGEDE